MGIVVSSRVRLEYPLLIWQLSLGVPWVWETWNEVLSAWEQYGYAERIRRKQMRQESAENRKRRTERSALRVSLTMYFASSYKSFSFLLVNTLTILAFRLRNLSRTYISLNLSSRVNRDDYIVRRLIPGHTFCCCVRRKYSASRTCVRGRKKMS